MAFQQDITSEEMFAKEILETPNVLQGALTGCEGLTCDQEECSSPIAVKSAHSHSALQSANV